MKKLTLCLVFLLVGCNLADDRARGLTFDKEMSERFDTEVKPRFTKLKIRDIEVNCVITLKYPGMVASGIANKLVIDYRTMFGPRQIMMDQPCKNARKMIFITTDGYPKTNVETLKVWLGDPFTFEQVEHYVKMVEDHSLDRINNP